MEIDVKTGKLTFHPAYEGTKVMIEPKGGVGESRFEVKSTHKLLFENRLWRRNHQLTSYSEIHKSLGQSGSVLLLQSALIVCGLKDSGFSKNHIIKWKINIIHKILKKTGLNDSILRGLSDLMIPIIYRHRLNTISVSPKPFPGSRLNHKITALTADAWIHPDSCYGIFEK